MNMVGGTVVGVSVINGEALLNVLDEKTGDECAVRCESRMVTGDEVRIEPGDKVWWQCGNVYWTPKRFGNLNVVCRFTDRDDQMEWKSDILLRKIGYSH